MCVCVHAGACMHACMCVCMLCVCVCLSECVGVSVFACSDVYTCM